MKISEFTDKKVTDNFSDHEDDSDSSFRFRPVRRVVSPHFQNRSGTSSDGELISVIDRRMEEYSQNILRAVEGLSVRLAQLETRTRRIEDSVTEIKDSSIFNHGRTEQKLNELENVLTEVRVGIRDLRDKQEISEVQIQMAAKLQTLKSSQKSEDRKTKVATTSSDQSVLSQQQHPTNTNIHQTPSYQNLPTPMPIPIPLPQFPTQSFYSTPYQPYPSQAFVDPRPYYSTQQRPPPLPRTSHNLVADPQTRHYPSHYFAGISHAPPRTHIEEASSRPNRHDDYARYGPRAEELPRALPMAFEVGSAESGSGGSGNTVPVVDVVDGVVAMGFRRDLVRATVKKLTENGQSVDLNVVLDKLMNS